MYNNVNSQQDATNFSFINLFNSALHVSGIKFAHPQELVAVYTAFGTMHRSAAVSVHYTKSWIYSKKVLLMMGEFVARNMVGWVKKINKRKSCCILLVVYIVVLMMHGHTNIKFMTWNVFTNLIPTARWTRPVTVIQTIWLMAH